MSSARHAKPSSKAAMVWGSTSLGLVLLLLLSVFTAISFARPDHSFAPPTEAKFFGVAVSDAGNLQPHPRALLTDFSGPQSIRVKRGQSLSSIAAEVLGSSKRWPILWWNNQRKVPNPNALRAGIRLHFGKWHHVRPWLSRRAMAAIPKPAPAPVAAAPTAPQPVASSNTTVSYSYSGGSGFQACVIARESGGNPQAVNASSGAGGLYQFLLSTWDALGFGAAYPGGAQTAPVSVQNAAFAKAFAESGTSPWAPYDGC